MYDLTKAIVHLNEKVSDIKNEVSDIKKEVELLKKGPDQRFGDIWMDGREVLVALQISLRTLQTLRDSGKLSASRLLGKYYYKVSDIKSLQEENYIRYHFTKRP